MGFGGKNYGLEWGWIGLLGDGNELARMEETIGMKRKGIGRVW